MQCMFSLLFLKALLQRWMVKERHSHKQVKSIFLSSCDYSTEAAFRTWLYFQVTLQNGLLMSVSHMVISQVHIIHKGQGHDKFRYFKCPITVFYHNSFNLFICDWRKSYNWEKMRKWINESIIEEKHSFFNCKSWKTRIKNCLLAIQGCHGQQALS